MGRQDGFDLNVLARLWDDTPDEVLVWDASYRLVYANKATIKNYGLRPEYLVGKTLDHCLAKERLWPGPPFPEFSAGDDPICRSHQTRAGHRLTAIATPVFNRDRTLQYVVQISREEAEPSGPSADTFPDYEEDTGDSIFMCKAPITKKILQGVNKIAKVNVPVLILGETGTGKSLLARHIHQSSPRKDGKFLSINMASISPSIMEAEFFGYAAGAFTGASTKGKKGFFELADGGTLFLDEIGEISTALQAKLLHALQDGEVLPMGAGKPTRVDVRIICATNCDLKQMVDAGKFRKDLYHRLNVFEVSLPPLRERPEDALLMAFYFLDKFNTKYGKKLYFSESFLDFIEHGEWNGNARELSNTIERCVVLAEGQYLKRSDMPEYFFETCVREQQRSPKLGSLSFDEMMREHEASIINHVYKYCTSSREIARALKLSQSKAYRLVQKHVRERVAV